MSMGVYAITNTINGNQYIGSSVTIQKRWRGHRRNLQLNKHRNSHLQSSYNKYGKSVFAYSVLEAVELKDDLIVTEQKYIDELKPEYNICPVAGNTLGYKHTEETKAIISASSKGRKISEEQKTKISAAHKGRKHTEEARARMSEAQKGKKHSEETRARMSATHTGRKHTEKAKAKMRLAWVERKQNKEE